jgi:predicted Ser/Thr protein kinase
VGRSSREDYGGPDDAIGGFVTGRLSYDALVRRLKALIADGSTSLSLTREAIAAATEMGRLPMDLSGILMNLFPQPVAAAASPHRAAETSDDAEDFDEPTLPHALVAAGDGGRQPEPRAIGRTRSGQAGGGPAAPRNGPWPATAQASQAASGVRPLPPMPVLPPVRSADQSGEPQASVPAHADIQAKVDDVVLSALISEFRGMRQARDEDAAEQVAMKPDALDGLLVNYRSARFRSDARRAARGAAAAGLKLGQLDDFASRRAGPGSILRERFVLDAEIGRGGMGIVYSAVDRRRLEAGSGQPYVALKLLNDEFRNNSEALRVLEAEARKAQSLAHPNIATVYDFDRDRSEIFIVMELLSGKPLSRILGASVGQPLPAHRAAAALKGICAGLAYAHRQGVVHSDLKPGNVFVGDDSVKLIDFGLATASAAGSFDVTALGGLTAAYASPEMFDDAPRDPRDDIFALGCIAYELVAGAHPFAMWASNEAAAQKLEPEPVADLDPTAWQAIRQALSFEREARTKSVEEFARALFEE